VAVATVVVLVQPRVQPSNVASQQSDAISTVAPSDSSPPPQRVSEAEPLPGSIAVPADPPAAAEAPAVATNKLDRLSQIRETFRALAAGDKTTALRAAKQIVDETERETTLVVRGV